MLIPYRLLLPLLLLLALFAGCSASPSVVNEAPPVRYLNPRLEMHIGRTPSGRPVAINLPPAPVLPKPLNPPLRTRENPDVGRAASRAVALRAVKKTPKPVARPLRTTGRTTVVPQPKYPTYPAPPKRIERDASAKTTVRPPSRIETANREPNKTQRALSISQEDFIKRLVAAARSRTFNKITYDPKYVKIPYPGGDVPANTGVCTDVIVRAYRQLNIDLQKEVHEDMRAAFSKYPTRWGRSEPDSNIDHRRVQNLMKYFERHGEKLDVTDDPGDYQPGDIVTWQLPVGMHIGIVVDRKVRNRERYQVVHNVGLGPEMEDFLFAYPIKGHYRYFGPKKSTASSENRTVETAQAR